MTLGPYRRVVSLTLALAVLLAVSAIAADEVVVVARAVGVLLSGFDVEVTFP